MWGNSNWGQMIWGGSFAVPALGPGSLLVLGCALGIIAVLCLRSARKVGLLMTLLVLLVPLAALASVPFIFANGTIADANQINQNFAAVIPLLGKSSVSTGITGTAQTFVFPASAAFVAPRDLRCVVTFQPSAAAPGGQIIQWKPATKVGTTSTAISPAGPVIWSMVEMPLAAGFDHNYSGTYTEVVQVSSGSSISFGAQFSLFSGTSTTIYQPTISTVYQCTPTP